MFIILFIKYKARAFITLQTFACFFILCYLNILLCILQYKHIHIRKKLQCFINFKTNIYKFLNELFIF